MFQGRSYKHYDEDSFRLKLCNTNWGRFYASFDVNTAWDELFNPIIKIADEMCPAKVFNIKNKKPSWCNDELIEPAANRDEFYGIGKITKDDNIIDLARKYRNKLKADYYIA